MHIDKEGSGKSRRVYAQNAEATESQKRNEKGKGKVKESRRKWRRMEEDEDEGNGVVEEEELKSEAMWWSFVTARMVMMSMALEKLTEENAELRREIWEIGKQQ